MNEATKTAETDALEMWSALGIDTGAPAPAPVAIVPVAQVAPVVHVAELVEAPARARAAVASSSTGGAAAPGAFAGSPYARILEKRIAEGTGRAAKVMEGIFRDLPKDQIAPVGKIIWDGTSSGEVFRVGVGDEALVPTDFAWGQIAERAGVPAPYLRELAVSTEGWRRRLASEILSRHYEAKGGERALVRSVNGALRGFLSDRYRRLDSRPLVEALVAETEKCGAIPFDGTATETRVALKVIVPEVIEPLPGEFLVLGAEWSNSDFGHGTHGVRAFFIRVVCLNGATRENLLKQVHLGARLAETIDLSDRTHRLDTATSVSALRDVVRGALGPARVETLTEQLRKAAEERVSSSSLAARVAKSQPKSVVKSVVDAYDSEDVINLPEGKTAWRASNAISWIARHTEDAERRLDLERLAGALV
jgi:hypothetical protein